ncbi:unnamed protein product [Parnassius apollo]|uniref:(apollo) hypothetical protein n=1 Tax=Parnassius apollo TaxID=110799 RepID=A0A8S3W4Y2_PARAO|nr:unnamed protein product [Parnassius apollo]
MMHKRLKFLKVYTGEGLTKALIASKDIAEEAELNPEFERKRSHMKMKMTHLRIRKCYLEQMFSNQY